MKQWKALYGIVSNLSRIVSFLKLFSFDRRRIDAQFVLCMYREKKREKTYVYAICMMVKWIMEQEYSDQQFRKRHCLRVMPRVLDESTVKRSIIIYRDSNLNKILRARRKKCWTKFEGWLKFFEIYLLFKIFKKNSNLFFALQVKKLWKIHWSCRIDKIDCYESV